MFRDPAVRFGLKLGIAGLLATYLALVLRLDEPTWALFTVFVLMVTPYVGAIMEKSVLRIFGTIIGAVLGYLLLGWQQQPLVMLPVVAGVLALCVAMFGQGLWSYGFFLCGLTLIDVMQAGLGDPQMSWRYALTRTEEVVLGIMVALLVQSLIWPRYAGAEFDRLLRDTLTELKNLLVPGVDSLFDGGAPALLERARKLPARVAKMRALINFGANESREFRAWMPVYEEIAGQVGFMTLSIASLSKPLLPSSHPHPELQSRMKAFGRALADGLTALEPDADKAASDEALLQIRVTRKDMEDALELARTRGEFEAETPGYLLSLGHHFQALIELAQACEAIRDRLQRIASGPGAGEAAPPVVRGLTVPSRFWIHLGIKGGIAVVAALLLENWLHPPGGDLLAISAWILLVRGPTAPAGRGDWRAFHGAALSILAWLLLGLLLLWVHPFLASYAVMNIVLFSLLFLWGYIFYGRNPMTTPMLVGMLMIVGVFGLNAQEPVSFQAIADLSVGMALAILLSALVRRIIWPSLPQREVLSRLRELSRISRSILEPGLPALSPGESGRLALIPAEVSTRLGLLKPPVVIDGDSERLREYLQHLHRGAMILSAAAVQSANWPARLKEHPAYHAATALASDLSDHLLRQEKRLDGRETPPSSLAETFPEKSDAVTALCRPISPGQSAAQWLGLLAFCQRIEEAGDAIMQATRASASLDWPALHEDNSL